MLYRATVDPGLGGTAISLWQETTWEEASHPYHTQVYSAPKGLEWLDRARLTVNSIEKVLSRYAVSEVWIEYPGFHKSAGGQASATRGDVFKLMFLVGMLADRFEIRGTRFHPLEVNQWKGTLSKEAVAVRVGRILDCDPKRYGNHIMDSVGMGLFVKGFFSCEGMVQEDPKPAVIVPVRRR